MASHPGGLGYRSLTFRVDEIPPDRDKAELHTHLQSILGEAAELQDTVIPSSLNVWSLVPRDKISLCASVSVRTSISTETLCTYMSFYGSQYTYSHDFQGLTPLYESENKDEIEADIMVVPGLGSHPLGSWKSPDSDKVWLRDFLPLDMPRIRVLLYGYDSTLPGSLSKQSVADLGQTLLEQIIAFRAEDKTSNRPLVFLAHSLGGILVKEALVLANKKRNNDMIKFGDFADLAKACLGMMFFGVPNLGLRNDQLRTLVKGQPNEALIECLLVDNDSEASHFLNRLGDQFSDICKGKYQVVSFYERMLSPTLELSPEGIWRRTGPPTLMVTEKSATSIGLVTMAEEDSIPLNRDHSGLVKFKYRAQGDYPIIRQRIRRIIEGTAVMARRSDDHSSENISHDKETIDKCLRSLAFEQMNSRQQMIERSAKNTCDWLLSHEALNRWKSHARGLLWIDGHPGSGKSTIMKFAIDRIPALCGPLTLSIPFFFFAGGSELQNSSMGLYRTILHQLVLFSPTSCAMAIQYFKTQCKILGDPGKMWTWDMQGIQEFIESSLAKVLRLRRIVLLVDALDEAGQKAAMKVLDFMKKLLSDLPQTKYKLGIIFSCRKYPVIELHEGLSIALERANQNDISRFVWGQLSKSNVDNEVLNIICDRAKGNFLWTRLVVDRVRGMIYDGQPNKAIKKVIEKVPPDLKDLYRALLQSLEDRQEALRLIQWITFAERPLTTLELQWALAIPQDCAYMSLQECYESDDFTDDRSFARRLKTLTCGLAEIVPSGNGDIVHFIHETARDFFLEEGIILLDQTVEKRFVAANAHRRLSRTCIRYLNYIFESGRGSQSHDIQGGFDSPLGSYATLSWLSHLKHADPAENNLMDIIEQLGLDQKKFLKPWRKAMSHFRTFNFFADPRMGLLHIAAQEGMSNMVSYLCSYDIDLNSCNSDGKTSLFLGVENGHKLVVKAFLSTNKVDVNSRDMFGTTPFSIAAQKGHEAILRMLLDTGQVKVNDSDWRGSTPLFKAAEEGNEAIVRILLDIENVDVELEDGSGTTPFSKAAENGHLSILRILISTGKVNIDSKDQAERTPLSKAVRNGHESTVRFLLDTGKVDVDSIDYAGYTPFLRATMGSNESISRLLFDMYG